MAQKIRPQFASLPKNAVFTRLEETTLRARVRAVSLSLAPATVISMNFCAPSPSLTISFASSAFT